MSAVTKVFRKTFPVPKEYINWYPGHMDSSLKAMKAKLKTVDCIIEVHDARIPYSGRNPVFLKSLLGGKPHILVLNKKDLTDKGQHRYIIDKFREEDINNVVYTNCLNQCCPGVRNIVTIAAKLIKETPRRITSEERRYKIMVIGIPNVGKSSLINALRHITLNKGKATSVGALPGVTKRVQNEIKVCSDPLMYLIDTPGIMLPNILDVECGMKLALCSCLRDDLVGIIRIADFWLYWMNKTKNFTYIHEYNLKEPIDEVLPLLIKIAVEKNRMKRIKNVVKNTLETVPDVRFAAEHIVRNFRNGHFGDIYLDGDFFFE